MPEYEKGRLMEFLDGIRRERELPDAEIEIKARRMVRIARELSPQGTEKQIEGDALALMYLPEYGLFTAPKVIQGPQADVYDVLLAD